MSNNNGSFELKNIPNGSFELIVSHLGFSRIYVNILFFKTESLNYLFELTPEPIKLNDITVTSKKNEWWEENYEIFCKYFDFILT